MPTSSTHLVTGNGYAEIVRDNAGRIAELHPLHPANVTPDRDASGQLFYRVQNDNGTSVDLDAVKVLHVAGPSRDGLVGLSVVAQHRQALGLSIAVEAFGAAFFGNGARPGGILEHPARLSKPVKDALRENLEALHRGVANAHRLAILEEGMRYHAISISPEDSQFLASRSFQTVEIARMFHMPASLLSAGVEGASLTYKNAQEERQAWVDFGLAPWALAFEQELNRKLLAPNERCQRYFAHRYEGCCAETRPSATLPTQSACSMAGSR